MVDGTTNAESSLDWLGPSLLRLSRAVRRSLSLRELILGTVGLILLHAGWAALEGVFRTSPEETSGRWIGPIAGTSFLGGNHLGSASDVVRSAAWRLTEPVRVLAGPLWHLTTPGMGAMSQLQALLAAVWAIAVWGIIGGAICRMTLVQTARDEGIGIGRAVGFALRFAVPLTLAPMCPLVLLGLCALLCSCFGLLYRLPGEIGGYVGDTLLFIPLILGLGMAVLLIGLVMVWPLMHAAVATEAEDLLDTLSRTFSYLNQRLGRFATHVVVAWLVGIPGLLCVDVLASAVVRLTVWALSHSAPAASLVGLGTPILAAGAPSQNLWVSFVGILARGWVYSYFWTVFSFIYLLLRQEVDSTSWKKVADAAEHGEASPS